MVEVHPNHRPTAAALPARGNAVPTAPSRARRAAATPATPELPLADLAIAALTVALLLLAVPAFAQDVESLILPKDLDYLGAFRMPNDLSSSANWASGGTGMTYRPDGDPGGSSDGFPGSLFAIGKDPLVSEVSIPTPVLSADLDPGDLPRAVTLQPMADITGGLRGAVDVDKLGGVAYLPPRGNQTTPKLYWTIYEYYNVAGDNYLSHGMSELNLSNPQPRGVWRLRTPTDPGLHSMKTADYIFDIPTAWADAHVGGKALVSGRHRENGAFGGCQGPALYAFAPWQSPSLAHGTELDAVCLLLYPTGGGHFPGYCAADKWTGGAWMDFEDRSAVLIVGVKGTGQQFYGDGDASRCSSSKGFHCDPYEAQFLFYNPNDLAAVARGDRQPWEVLPYATIVPSDLWPQCMVRPNCAAFDAERGLLYVLQYNGGRIPADNGTRVTVVHVFRVSHAMRPHRTVQPAATESAHAGAPNAGPNAAPSVAALSDPANVRITPNPIPGTATIALSAPGQVVDGHVDLGRLDRRG
ncbi:hypothetical protein K8I85_17415, partial [bacterium]|nr:hypothetical protein [bacterium]